MILLVRGTVAAASDVAAKISSNGNRFVIVMVHCHLINPKSAQWNRVEVPPPAQIWSCALQRMTSIVI